VAHAFARSLELVVSAVWVDVVPEFIWSVVYHALNVSV